MSSSLRFGDYLLLGRTNQNPRVDSYMAYSLELGQNGGLFLLSRLRSSARKVLPECADAFLTAGNYLKSLDVPSICHISEVGEHQGQIFWVRPYVNGRPLQQILKKLAHVHINVPENVACYIGFELAKSLPGILPEAPAVGNGAPLLLCNYGRHTVVGYNGSVVNADMGLSVWLAKQQSSKVTEENWRTPYISPEEIAGKDVGFEAAVYTLGTLMYEVASGRRIFARASDSELVEKISQGDFQPLKSLRSNLSREFCDLIDSMLSVENINRPVAAQIIDYFNQYAADGKEALIELLASEFKTEQESDAEKFAELEKKIADSNNNPIEESPEGEVEELEIDEAELTPAEDDNYATKQVEIPEDYNATIISSATAVSELINGEDPFGNTLPSTPAVKPSFEPPVDIPTSEIEAVAVPLQSAATVIQPAIKTNMQQPVGFTANPYMENYNMMQQMYNQPPMGQPPMGMMPQQAPKGGFGAGGWALVIISFIIAGIMIFCSAMYAKGKLPQLERFGLPHIGSEQTVSPAIVPSSGIVPAGNIVPAQNK